MGVQHTSAKVGHPGSQVKNSGTTIFLHIPKTAGSTLAGIMARNFRRKTISHPEPMGSREQLAAQYTARQRFRNTGQPTDLHVRPRNSVIDPSHSHIASLRTLPPERLSAIRLMMGHLWFGIHDAIPGPFSYVTMVRNPIERVLSMYQHLVNRHEMTVDLETFIFEKRDPAIDNAQTRRLVGRLEAGRDIRLDPLDRMILEQAKRNVEEHFSFVGVQERFDESVLLMAKRMSWRTPFYVSRMVGKNRPARTDTPKHIIEEIERLNRWDLELWEWANGRLPTWGTVRADDIERFRSRNRRYQPYGRARTSVGGAVRNAIRLVPEPVKGPIKRVRDRIAR